MEALIGLSLWVVIATIIPGVITIATMYLSVVVAYPALIDNLHDIIKFKNDWIVTGIALVVIILTQALGILVENLLIKLRAYGPKEKEITIPEGIDPLSSTNFILRRYDEYQGLYLLLVELGTEDDTQCHLNRILAQFFLSNNTMVGFFISLVLALVLSFVNREAWLSVYYYVYILFLMAFIFVSWNTTCTRFIVMTKSLWALRRKKMIEKRKSHSKGKNK
jgi:hypothetical protein